MSRTKIGETLRSCWEKYRYVALIAAIGAALLLWPEGEKTLPAPVSAAESGTDLAADYAAGKFEVLTPEHYIDLLEQCLRVLPPEVVIHRLTGDGAKRDLIAPLWSADKKRVLKAICTAFARDDLVQGSEL